MADVTFQVHSMGSAGLSLHPIPVLEWDNADGAIVNKIDIASSSTHQELVELKAFYRIEQVLQALNYDSVPKTRF